MTAINASLNRRKLSSLAVNFNLGMLNAQVCDVMQPFGSTMKSALTDLSLGIVDPVTWRRNCFSPVNKKYNDNPNMNYDSVVHNFIA